nr:translation initiation factor IF-2 [Oryctolagus cuniculus]
MRAQTLERVVIISPGNSKPGRVPISKAETRHWTGSKFSRRERFFQVPSLPAQGPGPCTQSSACGTAPHFRSLRPGTQQGLVPGEGLVSSSFLSVPHLRRPLRPPGAEHGRGRGHPPGRCHMLPRPKRPLQVAGAAAVPRAGPAAPAAARPSRPDGGRDRALPRKFQVFTCGDGATLSLCLLFAPLGLPDWTGTWDCRLCLCLGHRC